MKQSLRNNIGKLGIILLICVFLAPAVTLAFGDRSGKHDRGFGEKMGARSPFGIWEKPQIVESLKLTDEQIEKLKTGDFAFRKEQLEAQGQMKSLDLEMDKALAEDTTDDDAIIELAKKLSEIRGNMFVRHIEARLEIKKILSADQLETLKNLIRERHDRRRDKMSRRGKFGPRQGADETPEK